MNILVTGGGAIAPIDEVRSITNSSSGAFSAAITEACLERGADVWHLHTPQAQLPLLRQTVIGPEDLDAGWMLDETFINRAFDLLDRWKIHRKRLHLVGLDEGTVSEYAMVLEMLLRSQPFDIVFLAMAVSDYAPTPSPGKVESTSDEWILTLKRQPKIIAQVRDWAPEIYLVGFKLMTEVDPVNLIATAERACLANRADATLANDLALYRAGKHTVHLVRPNHVAESIGPDPELASKLVDRILRLADEKLGRR